MSEHDKTRRGVVSVLALVAVVLLTPLAANAQSFVKCPTEGRELLKVPEITRDDATKKLQAVLKVSDQDRAVWFPRLGPPDACAAQHLRFFEGYSLVHPNETWPVSNGLADPLPGPTFRARVGDMVEISFFNQIDLTNFPNSQYFDREGCDESVGLYPKSNPGVVPTINDTPPNCFHGSSTANVHFHGTHTNPGSTGDNVLLQIRPSPRQKGKLLIDESTVKTDFTNFFQQCEEKLVKVPYRWPFVWEQLPENYRTLQHDTLTKLDQSLKPGQQLWPPNQEAIDHRVWPQYYAGAYPYCFQLPEYPAGKIPAIPPSPAAADPNILQMGQAPGTMWYHMHKHGSTTLNVNNTLIGAFIIEGLYDDQLKEFYKADATHTNWGLTQKVMVIQEVGVTPNLERGPNQQKGPIDPFSVNGLRHPMVTMHPGEVQLWRIINGGARSGVYFVAPAPSATAVQWVQIAQDGVQFDPRNYLPPAPGGASQPFLMSAGNRVDLLVRVPKGASGKYNLQVYNVARATEVPTAAVTALKTIATLLTVNVVPSLTDPNPEMPFVSADKFPTFPSFLPDIPESTIHVRRELTFNSTTPASGAEHTIDGHKFGETIDQAMLLNTNEEWKIINTTSNLPGPPGAIMHPFHIHINPFQIVEIFDPYDKRYVFKASDYVKGTNCYVNPADRTTWHPCDVTALKPPFVWWDVFGIPGARVDPNPGGTIIIPGYFKMRSRFADYPGQYVLHCHILAHEDRGMMQLIEVVPNTTTLKHH